MSEALLNLSKRHKDLLIITLNNNKQSKLIKINGSLLYCKPSDREEICQVLLDEFCNKGLKADDEPNSLGLELEDLIDSIRREDLG